MERDTTFIRTEKLLGKDGVNRLKNSSVIIFGLGGVGGYVVEALARSGVGSLALVDFDTVAQSNLNRQIIATQNTVGMKKTEAAKKRVFEINPEIKVTLFDEFFDENSTVDLAGYDYVVDAIDSVKSKIFIAEQAYKKGVKEICCLSAGNKLDATRFKVADVYSTTVCPLAKLMRKKLREKGIKNLKVVFSDEERAEHKEEDIDKGKNVGSLAYVVGVVGLIAAGEVIKDIAFGADEE